MPATLTRDGDVLTITLKGRWSEIDDDKEKVKLIPGRRWNPDKMAWEVPADPANADRLLKMLHPECDDELMQWLKDSMVHHEESLTTELPDDAPPPALLIPWGYKRMAWQPEEVNDEQFTGALPYQRAAIDAMAKWGRALLCDDMGLGKTFETISAVEEWCERKAADGDGTRPEGPKLVIAPASVMGGWKRELNRWLKDPNVQIIDGYNAKKRYQQLKQAILEDAWVILNWEMIRTKRITAKTRTGGTATKLALKEALIQYPQAAEWDIDHDGWDLAAYRKADREFGKGTPGWLAAIADEIHRAKNPNAKQTEGLHRIRGQVEFGLTGTPLMNSPDELWGPLAWLYPDQYHEHGEKHAPGAQAYWSFYQSHVDFWEDQHKRKVITGVKNPDALKFALKGKLIRRTFTSDHPRKRIYYDVDLTPQQQAIYDEVAKSMWVAIQEDAVSGNAEAIALLKAIANDEPVEPAAFLKIPNGVARYTRLQMVVENAALVGGPESSANMDDFEAKFEEAGDNQWMVMCKYKQSAEILAQRLRKRGAEVGVYTGDVSPAERTAMEDQYQAGKLDVVVGTIAALYQGITLTSGHLQHWLSRSEVPAVNEQGEARQDRKGQQKQVIVYIPQGTGTIARTKIHVLNEFKEGIVKTVIQQNIIERG